MRVLLNGSRARPIQASRTIEETGAGPEPPTVPQSASLLEGPLTRLAATGSLGTFGEIGLARAQGHAAVVRGDTTAARERFAHAVDVADASGNVLSATLARIDAARVLAESEDRDAAIRDARRDAESMGAAKLLADLDEIEGITHEEAAEA